MEVMNRAELTQNEILVGQRNVTRSFGVSDDPMLMSMLSTGFYQNPLRTMIQEIMFNAWDAHRMGNCQHRPIDIYINDTTGLIIRDYGPGIEPGENDDNMHEIYCMYGGSTKRKLKNQTGGFGLGSKSPFAYTESFTVTSHFGGTKSMYLISRVSEANGGKPGMTRLVQVPTTETGLMVTVPLKAGQTERAYDYVKDVLFLSGIKAMVHFMEEPDEFIDSLILPAGSYYTSEDHRGGSIYAVYGGVRYKIPSMDEYREEYEFMKLLANKGDIFVGFAPDTLSPLPNREGLNMGEKSKESVKATFELCTEKFQKTFKPVTKVFFKAVFNYLSARKIQGEFAFIKAADFGFEGDATNIAGAIHEQILKGKPDDIDEDVWKIATNLVVHQTKSICRVISYKTWITYMVKEFIAVYPESSALGFAALKGDKLNVFPIHNRHQAQEFVSYFTSMKFLRDQQNFVNAMKAEYPLDDSLHPQMRVHHNDKWIIPIRERTKAHISKTKYGIRGIKAEDPKLARKSSYPSLEAIYNPKDGDEMVFTMMNKTVMIAKTAMSLNDSSIPGIVVAHDSLLKQGYRYFGDVRVSVPAYVIYDRKGAYDKAKKILEDQGFTVLEGMEPEKKVYAPKVKTVPTYPMIFPKNTDSWMSSNPNDQITDPTHFYYATLATIRGYNSRERPNHGLVYWFLKKNPKTVTVTNIKTAENLEKSGVKHLHDGVESWYKQASSDVNRIMNVIRASNISQMTDLPDEMVRHPMMQLELGMEPVDPKDEDFWYEAEGYNLIANSEYYPLQRLSKIVKDDIQRLWKTDPERENIESMCRNTKFFAQYALSSLWSSTKPEDRDQLVDKIIAAMKLFG